MSKVVSTLSDWTLANNDDETMQRDLSTPEGVGWRASARQRTTSTMMSKTTERSADLNVAIHSSKLEAAVARSSSLDADATALQVVADGHHACRREEDLEQQQLISHMSRRSQSCQEEGPGARL